MTHSPAAKNLHIRPLLLMHFFLSLYTSNKKISINNTRAQALSSLGFATTYASTGVSNKPVYDHNP